MSTLSLRLVGGITLALLCAAYLLFDRLAAISLLPLAGPVAALLSLPPSLLLAHAAPRRARLLLPVAVVLLLLSVSRIDWDTRKPFLRALDRVTPGMTVAEVEQVMAPYRRVSGARGEPPAAGLIGYRHADAGWGDADIAVIVFADDRVVARRFLPD